MNKRGWGLPEMIILSAIIIIALIIAAFNIKKLSSTIDAPHIETTEEETNKDITVDNKNDKEDEDNEKNEEINENEINNDDKDEENTNDTNNNYEQKNNEEYLSIEGKMVEAAIRYITNNYNITNKATIIVDKSHLIEQDKNLENDMSNYNCNGYVTVTSDSINNYYTPYLKCDSYTTSGYNSTYAN